MLSSERVHPHAADRKYFKEFENTKLPCFAKRSI